MGRAADVDQLLLDLPDLEVTEHRLPGPLRPIEILHIGTVDTLAWPVDVSLTRRRDRPDGKRRIHLEFRPEETPGDVWFTDLTPEQARYAAAMLVAAARAAEEVPSDE